MLRRVLLFALMCSATFGAEASGYAPFEGGRVHYESYGAGREALVFIHGWTCDLTFWRGQEPVYTAHRSLLIDLPGHGLSNKPMGPYPPEFFARGIEAAMTYAGIERAVLVGHSLGGPIAYAFLRLFPEKVKALVLVDATFSPGLNDPDYKAALQTRYKQKAASLSGSSGEKYFLKQVETMFSPKTTPDLREEIRTKMLSTPEWVRVAAVTSVPELGPLPRGQTFNVPAIAIQAASKDTDQYAGIMRTVLPKLRVEKWQNSGHFLMMEDPARFNRSLEKFLSGLSAP